MKPGLKRIEATLDQLEVQEGSPVGVAEGCSDFNAADDRSWQAESWQAENNVPHPRTKAKLQVEPFPLPKGSADSASVSSTASQPKEHSEAKLPLLPADIVVEPVAALPDVNPEVPISQFPGLALNRQAANPNLAIGLLKEFETLVKGWQKDLEQTIQQIQTVYKDGPIVDGWLESYPPGAQAVPPAASVSMLRHAEIEQLMAFIEQICEVEQAQITEDMRRTSYRLCGLDPDGKMWSRPCPSEQVPYVSLAIARYQKLRTLLTKKQTLENRLTTLVESLTMLHAQIREG